MIFYVFKYNWFILYVEYLKFIIMWSLFYVEYVMFI